MRRRILRRAGPAALLAALWLGCQGPAPPAAVAPAGCPGGGPISHAVFLIGDAGAPRLARDGSARLADPVLQALHRDVAEAAGALGDDHVAVVFLGDNVYQRGLVPAGEPDRRRGERVLEAQIAASAPARAIFLAGNHDWEIEGPRGFVHVRAQREFLASRGPRVSMLPPGGCSGPERVDFGPYLRFVFIDPIGFSHLVESPELHADCRYHDVLTAFLALSGEFDRPEGHHVVLALHHPLITAGPHGGHYTWKQHLFPLTDFWPRAWVPLPILGSIYPLARQLGVTGTDLASAPYQRWIEGIYRASRPLVPLLFAGGHEHSLQVHRDAVGAYYAVSGAGSISKVNRVEFVQTALLSAARPGYMRLDAHAGGDLALHVLAVHRDASRDEIFGRCLVEGPPRGVGSP